MQPAIRRADTPSGYDAKLTLPYNDDPAELANPTLRDTEVTLPEGVAVNPASADGLGACSTEQIGLLGTTFAEPHPIHFSLEPARCPESSKIGTVEVRTPLLDHPLQGAFYVAEQVDNPFGSLIAIYIAIDDPQTGIVVKLAGETKINEQSGQITATFLNNPQIPFTELDVTLFGGPRASLANPLTCGTKTTRSVLTPWSAPYTPAVFSEDSFTIASGAGGSPCVTGESQAPHSPFFEAGTVTPIAGTHSPFVLNLRRNDGAQRPAGLDLTLPPGLSGKLAGIPYCPEAAIAQVRGRTALGDGKLEQASPSCPATSQLGTVTAGAGVGPSPLHVQGKAYLAGPYKGAPLSTVIVTPAMAGPFDLGVVVVRAALQVDPRTARVHAISDPIPHMLRGIPLGVRSISLDMTREQFTLNPTNCDPMSINGSVASLAGQVAPVSSRFQVGVCAALPFKPKLALRLTGRKQVTTGKHPGVKAQVNQTGIGEAGIEKAVVRLPKSLALDPDNAQALCEFTDGTKDDLEKHCPKGSIVGRARAVTPLLDEPLVGNVYFVKNIRTDAKTGNQIRTLPMIVVALRGEVAVNLYGKSSTTRSGKLVNTFDEVPDAPISRFNLNINGGNNGILAVTRTRRSNINLCAGRHTAETDMDGQNGKRRDFDVRMKTPCTKRQTKAAKRAAKRAAKARKARS